MLVSLSVLFLYGCASSPELAKQGTAPPEWLRHIPSEKGELCASGVSGPTYYPEDAVVNSKAQALTELTRSLKTTIQSRLLVQQGGTSESSEVTVNEASALSSQGTLQLARVRSQWVNPGGFPTHGEKGTVYTLVCMPLGNIQP